MFVGVGVRVCDIEFVVFTDCESCTYEADFHKPGIYGSGRVRVNAWDVVFRAPSRGGRGRRAAVAFALCFGWGGLFRDYYFSDFFFSERTRPAASMRPPCLIYLSASNEARPRERRDRGRFLPRGQKKGLFIPGCVQGAII